MTRNIEHVQKSWGQPASLIYNMESKLNIENKKKKTKNYPRARLTVDSLESQLSFLPSSKSRDTKTRINIKNPAWPNLDNVL